MNRATCTRRMIGAVSEAVEVDAHGSPNVCLASVVGGSRMTEERLDSLYESDGFGGEKTMRAKVIRDLIDEIRRLRRELAHAERHDRASVLNPEGMSVGTGERPALQEREVRTKVCEVLEGGAEPFRQRTGGSDSHCERLPELNPAPQLPRGRTWADRSAPEAPFAVVGRRTLGPAEGTPGRCDTETRGRAARHHRPRLWDGLRPRWPAEETYFNGTSGPFLAPSGRALWGTDDRTYVRS